MKKEKAPVGERTVREKLCDFLNEITGLILPEENNDESAQELKQSKHAALCILLDGKCVFGIPIVARTDSDVNNLLSAVDRYRNTL